MTEYLLFAIIVIQWLFICWVGYGARKERSDLMVELMNTRYQTHTLSQYAPEITMPHPDTGAELRFQHLGNGQYGPSVDEYVTNNVAEVEGS